MRCRLLRYRLGSKVTRWRASHGARCSAITRLTGWRDRQVSHVSDIRQPAETYRHAQSQSRDTGQGSAEKARWLRVVYASLRKASGKLSRA